MGGIIRHFIASMREMFFDESGHFYLKKYDKIRVAFLVACTLGFILLSNLVAPIQFGEPDTEATSQSTQPSTLTLTSTTNTATVSINPTPTGVFGKSSDANSIKFNISTNNYSGYTISARTTRTTLINGSSSLTSLASAVSESQFSNSGNTTLNNRWGYKPNYYNSSSNSNFLPSPGTSSSTLDHTTAANSTAKNYTIVLGARVNTEVPAGTYVNDTLVLEATANAVPYTIKFNKAADDDIVSNMPANQTGSSVSANNITLSNTTPTRVNYTFAGWCTTIPVASAGGYTCNGTTYAPGSDYNINFTVDNTDNNLYAIWTSTRGCNKAATTIGTGNTNTDAVCMQDINDTVITSMTEGTQHTLIDMRDGKSYFIAKQADGKVWMTQNLDYDLSTSVTLTHNNTDLGYTTSNLAKTWTPSNNTITGSSEWVQDNTHAVSKDHGDIYDYDGTKRGEDFSTTCIDNSTCAHYHAGNYYNWPAAVAENLPTGNSVYTVAEDSVCPAGWRIAKGADSSYTVSDMVIAINVTHDIGAFLLMTTDDSSSVILTDSQRATIIGSPLYLISDFYYTNVRKDATNAYDVYIKEMLSNKTYDEYYYGASIRCIARMTTGTTTVNFHGNGASNTMASRTVPSGDSITTTNEFEYEGHKFIKWNTAADGTGTDFTATSVRVAPNVTTTFDLYAQWEEAFIIKYDGNGADSGHGMSKQHEVADGETITLAASNFKRAGYGFLGWSATQIDPDAADFATQLANANIFGPTQTIVATAAAFNKTFPATATLYAVWIKSAGDIQDWLGCSSMSIGDVTARNDTRNNETYAIAKLADGNCWMIENLRLSSAYSTDSTKAQGFGGNFWGLADSEFASFNSGLVENSLYTPNSSSTTKKIITGNFVEYRIPRFSLSSSVVDYSSMNARFRLVSHGGLYNWPAAMANTNQINTANISQNSGTSICPSGWRLPTGSSTGEFGVINNLTNSGLTTSSAGLRKYPNNFIYAGYMWNSTVNENHTMGYYWSSTVSSDNGAYILKITGTQVDHQTSFKTVGASIRCIATNGIEIKLDANDASNRVARLYGESSTTVTIPEKQFERPGYVITSWNTSPDGSGISYTTSYTVGSSSITLYAQWASAYNIYYNGNNNTSNTNMDYYAHLNIASGESVRLNASNYLRTGYGFLGWSKTQINPDASNASSLISSTKIYGPNETVTVDSTFAGQSAPANITLYAVWIKSSGNLQEWNGCVTLNKATFDSSTGIITPGSVIALTDSRDGETYAIARLTNGECWMVENLRLDIKTASITMANTNSPTNDFLTNRTNNYNWCSSATADCAERYLETKSSAILSYGGYYNFYTASAGNGEYETNTDLEGDICPKGWHLPIAQNSYTGVQSLLVSLGGTNSTMSSSTTPTGETMSERLRTYPQNLIYSGTSTSGTFYDQDWGMIMNSSQWNNGNNYYYYYLGASNTQVRQTYGYSKYAAMPIRCVKNLGAIIYDGNGATGSTSMSNTLHTDLNTSSTVKLFASNYSRSGYGFVGWSKTQIDPDAANAATQVANATIWGPNEMVDVSNFTSDVNTLYAVWVKSAGNLQNWNGCSSLSQGSVTALKDTRDNQVYAVAKLADGNCWMIENLRLDSAGSTDSTKAQGYGGSFQGLANSETSTIQYNSTIANSLYTTDTSSTSLIVIRGDRLGYRIPRYNNMNTANTVSVMTNGDQNIYSYGNYYNWSAGNATTNLADDSHPSDLFGTSLCPTGWKLPSSATDMEFSTLVTTIGQTNITNYPNNFITAGYMYYGSRQLAGNNGSYLSSTLRKISSFYDSGSYLTMTATSASVGSVFTLGTAHTVRCVLASGLELKLDANDGTDRVSRKYATSGTTINLSNNEFEYDGYSITSWNTAADGSGISYTTSYQITSNTTLYAQWDEAYTINYNHNHTTTSYDNTFFHLNVVTGDKITLYEPLLAMTGYAFIGWSTTQIAPDAANATALIANAKIFGPNETITVNSATLGQSAPANITLYAVWLASSGTIQNWTGCNSLTQTTYSNGTITPGSVIALTDERDDKTYAVAKYSDGRCWMMEHLRLDVNTANITYDNTNKPTATFMADKATSGTSCTDNSASCIERILYNKYINTPTNSSMRPLGYYYNWYTATAGNGTAEVTSVSGDICPAGWHIPSGGTGTSSEFASLNYSISGQRANLDSTTTPTAAEFSEILSSYPYNFVYSGHKTTSTDTNLPSDYRTAGYLWSSIGFTNSSQYYGQYHSISETYARLSYGYQKQNFLRIRCIKNIAEIVYNGNGADSSSNMSVTHTATPSSSITLYASNYKRDGYGFLGWSFTQLDPDASNYATQLANTTVYGPNQTITLPSNLTDSATLYAVWIKSAGNMQGWSGCSSLSAGGVTALKDTRDNQVYAVAKLADGNCWMIENLRLNATDSADMTKAQGFGGIFVGLANSELSSFASVSTANSLYNINTSAITSGTILGDNAMYRIPRYNNTNTANTVANMTDSAQNIYSYGNYYSFAAANATTSEMKTTTDSENSGTSICPLGWRLPTNAAAGGNKELETLNTLANSGSTTSSTGLRTYPNNFIYSGYVWNSSFSHRGVYGEYSSTSSSGGTSGYIYEFSSSTSTPISKYRSFGATVRCIAATGIQVTLNANDGSDKISHIYGTSGSSVTLPMDTFSYGGYKITSWNTNAAGTGTSYTSTYTFSSNTTLYAQWTAAYDIIYDTNGATTGNMTGFSHMGLTNGSTAMLYSKNIERTGYGFAGWSPTQLDPDAANFSEQLANTKVFGPNETITANATNLGVSTPATVTLYAVWVPSNGTMQNWLGCESLTATTYSNGTITPGSVIALTDSRDNRTYAIARLADGHCWTIEDLRTYQVNADITVDNTNAPTSGFLTARTTTNSWCTATNDSSCVERSLSTYYTDAQYSGRYYNWYTATAGNGLLTTTGNVTGDLCPKGWHMPTGNTNGLYANLGVALGGSAANMTTSTTPTGGTMSARFRTFPNNFAYDGNMGTSLGYLRSWGYYLTSTGYYHSTNQLYYYFYFGINNDNTRYGYLLTKNSGAKLRCIATNASDPYTISYNGNSATGGSVTNTHSVIQGDTVRLVAPNYYRTGYGFVGWSFSSTATVGGSATIYGPNETITITSTILSGADNQRKLTLYAVWQAKDGTNTMQAFTEANCSSMSTGQIKVLTDSRDSNTYPIAKLSDGNCWMIDNLRINPATASITTSNTNNPTSAFLSARTSASSSDSWCTDNTNTSCTDTVAFRTGTWYAYGNMYNYYTATAGNGTTTYRSANGDICPTGWRLPTGIEDDNAEYTLLNTAINSGSTTDSDGFRKYPNNFVYSGYMSGTSYTGNGSQGRYISSYLFGSTNRYVSQLRIQNTSVNVNGGFSTALGTAVRCLRKTTKTYTLTYNANGGSGAPSSQSGSSTSGFANHILSGTTPTRSGYAFLGWSESSTATSASYSAGGVFQTANTNATLYAVWRNQITLTYNANGGSGGFSIIGSTSGSSYTFTIASDVPTATNATFLGWADSATASAAQYTAGNTLTLSADKTIYAVWQRVYTLDFNSDGGSPTPSTISYTTVNKTSQTFTIPSTVPTLANATFKGWSFICSSAYPRTTGLYLAGSTYTTNAPLTTLHLCAVWEREYWIYLDYNNDTGGKGYVPTTTVYPYKFTFESYDNPEWSGHTFKGWSESSTATTATYLPGSTYTFPTGVLRKTFYAVWN